VKVSEVMSRDVLVVSTKSSVQAAARQMKDGDVGLLPVCDGEGLQGMITDRDITITTTADGREPATLAVEDVMTPDVVYCFEDQEVEEAALLMKAKEVRRLVVLNRDQRLVGIVSMGDLAQKTGDALLTQELVKEVSRKTEEERSSEASVAPEAERRTASLEWD